MKWKHKKAKHIIVTLFSKYCFCFATWNAFSLLTITEGGYSTFAERNISTRWTIWTDELVPIEKKTSIVYLKVRTRGFGLRALLKAARDTSTAHGVWKATEHGRAAGTRTRGGTHSRRPDSQSRACVARTPAPRPPALTRQSPHNRCPILH